MAIIAFLVLCIDLTLAVAGETFTNADKSPDTLLVDVVSRSTRIARIRIVDRIPVGLLGEIRTGSKLPQDSRICGHYYRAVVIESLKGKSSEFQFFSAVDEDFKGFDRDYLVFVYERNSEKVKQAISSIADIMSVSDRADLMCKAFGSLFVPVQPQLLRAFIPEAELEFGGMWLELPSRDSILWCGEGLGAESTGFFVSRRISSGDRTSTVVGWRGIKNLILAADMKRYRFWDGNRLDGC